MRFAQNGSSKLCGTQLNKPAPILNTSVDRPISPESGPDREVGERKKCLVTIPRNLLRTELTLHVSINRNPSALGQYSYPFKYFKFRRSRLNVCLSIHTGFAEPTDHARGRQPLGHFVAVTLSPDGSRVSKILGGRTGVYGPGRPDLGPDLAIFWRSGVSQQPGTRGSWSMRRAPGSCTQLLSIVSRHHPTEATLQGLTRHSLDQQTRQSFLIVLIELVKRRRRLPDSIMITEKTMAEENVYTSGGFWDVRRGTLNNSAIAIKTPRITTTTDVEKIREVSWILTFLLSMWFKHSVQRFCREVILWNSLSHPNILKLTGVLGSIDTFNFSTVSEWMTHETIMKYTKTADVDRLQLVRTVADFFLHLVLNSGDLVTRSSSRPEVHA